MRLVDYAAGVFGLHLETAGQIASRLNQIVVYGLPDDYYHLHRDNIRAVSTEQVTSAVKEHIRPEEVQVIIVGDCGTYCGFSGRPRAWATRRLFDKGEYEAARCHIEGV
ncbi:MAG: hypothetical protein CM1200mP14_09980 [Gammaproteobacteria bacterium]|nr:MAG: hypothetical protein CM1200mP14_09980 [Gammaproteobacteria bacterium]